MTSRSLFILRLRARLGDAKAAGTLGAAYATGDLFGKAVPQSSREAFAWYERAALRGDPVAQYETGLMWLLGEGCEADVRAGRVWLERSAEQGYAEAMRVLADQAFGLPKDKSHSDFWAAKLRSHLSARPEDAREFER